MLLDPWNHITLAEVRKQWHPNRVDRPLTQVVPREIHNPMRSGGAVRFEARDLQNRHVRV